MILLSEKWQEKNIEFVSELEEVTLVTDKNLMMQVWINLIVWENMLDAVKSYITVSEISDLS